MKNPTNNKRRIILRYVLFVGCMFLFAACICVKLFKTTVIYAGDWNDKANHVLQTVNIIQPERGKILSDDGTVIAANVQFRIARIDLNASEFKKDTLMKYLPALCDSLAIFEPSHTAKEWSEELLTAYKDYQAGKRNRSFRLMKRNLTNKEYERLRSFPFFNLGPAQSGIHCDVVRKRTKPFGSMAARSIGNVQPDTAGFLHGSSGLEMALDSMLYGTPGTSTKIQLTNGIFNGVDVDPITGYDITTTININMQDIVENELYTMCVDSKAQWGTAILMEVATGEIKAISNLEWNSEAGDYIEGRNNAVLGYEPGSVMKPISMLVALEEGVVKGPDQMFAAGGSWTYAGKVVKDHSGPCSISAAEIIARSSNVGMSRIIVSKYGSNPGGFRDKLEEMGFFEPFNSGIGGERQPVIRRLGKSRGDQVDLTRMAFGYSTLIPPLSTLAVYNAVANDGKYVRPHLVKKLSREGSPDSIVPVSYIRDQICSPKNAQSLRQMLHAVVWSEHGTAHRYLQSDKVDIAGKTGTAYTNSNGQYSSAKRYAFCGFFPYANPKYSCMVLMMGADRPAPACSGMVLKNIALKLYARGMLGNESTYKVETDEQGNAKKIQPTKATLYGEGTNDVRNDLNIQKASTFKKGVQPKNGVPNVVGMSSREAVAMLEAKGINVKFSGMGYVVRQSLAPGSQYKRGDYITLYMKH